MVVTDWELRKAGHTIEITDRDRATGHVIYELRSE